MPTYDKKEYTKPTTRGSNRDREKKTRETKEVGKRKSHRKVERRKKTDK